MLPVPDAEAAVGTWRKRFDPSASQGMPAHITVLFPFLSIERIGGEGVHTLRRLFAATPALSLRLSQFGSFPHVLFLRPEPATPLVGLTRRVVERWPQAPPYAGAFAEVVPHLTVAMDVDDAAAVHIRAEIERALPIDTVVSEAWLMAYTGGRWSPVETFSLGGTRRAAL